MTTIKIHNVETGEITERELTKAELTELAKSEAADAAKMSKRAAEIAARDAVLAKLGITAEEVTALLA